MNNITGISSLATELYTNRLVTDNLDLKNPPTKTSESNVLYINDTTGRLSKGLVSGSVPDPLTIGTVNSTNLSNAAQIQTNTLKLNAISLATAANILYYDATSKLVSYSTAPTSSLLSGCSFVNTTNLLMNTIPTVVTKIPITNTSTPATTWTFNWNRDWNVDTVTPNNSRLIYSGSTAKKFIVRVNMNLSSAGVGANVYTALYINGALSGNNISGQFVSGTFATWTYTSEFYITLSPSQYIELYAYGSSTGIILGTSSNNFGGGTNVIPAITILVEEVTV